MRRALTVALGVVLPLVLLPAAALAHASFDVREVPAGAEQELVLRVPLERDAANERVEVLVPSTFTIASCEGADGWTCTQAETAEGDVVVTLDRGPDGDGTTERFALTVVTPAEQGVYAFPTVQTYDDGHEESWIGETGEDQPAPRLQVGDETAEVAPNESPNPHGEPAGATGSEDPAVAPTEVPTQEASPASPASPDAAPSASATPDVDGTPTASESQAPDGPVSEGGPSAVVLLVGVALLAMFGVAVAIARSRSST